MPYSNGDPTLGEQVEAHMETRREAEALRKVWDEAYAAGLEDAAKIAADHGVFCSNEGRHGGHVSLFERAAGAHYIAAQIMKLAPALRSLKLRIHNIDADDALARAAVAAENIVDDELNPALEAAGDAANRLHPQAITSEPKARWG